MPVRALVTGLLASITLLSSATLARADVTLTDQRSFTNRTAYGHGTVAGGQQQGPVSAPLATGQVPRLIDATGLEWFINDEVTYATTSSSVGAASDAVFVGAVEATTAAGG